MRKIHFYTFLITFTLFSNLNFGQSVENDSLEVLKVEVIKDSRIDKLNEAYRTTYKLMGYRVQIYSGNKKQPAKQARLDFTRLYRKTNAHESYEQPYFKVRVGDFKTKIEAIKFRKKLLKHFPNCFIVEDEIEFEE